MPTPNAPKQMVISSLNSLHKKRTRAMFRLKANRQDQAYLKREEIKVLEDLMSVEKKILWEINTHQKLLGS